jgi:hypothetical protein
MVPILDIETCTYTRKPAFNDPIIAFGIRECGLGD